MGKKKTKARVKVLAGGMPAPEVLAGQIVAELEKTPGFLAQARSGGAVLTPVPDPNLANADALDYGSAGAMPRGDAFALIPFNPGYPLIPAPIGPRRPDSTGRPEVRRWEFPVSWNLQLGGAPNVPWRVLRDSAEFVDLIRRCIEVRKAEMTALTWDIGFHDRVLESASAAAAKDVLDKDPTKPTGVANLQARIKAKQSLAKEHAPAIERIRNFWKTPDRLGNMSFADWLNCALEEYFVLDALTIYPHQELSGELHSFEVIDGSTIKPLLDGRGGIPAPPEPAYQQILYGFPRGEWSMAPLDADGGGSDTYTADEIIYRPRHRRAFTPYGHSPVEKALVSADLWLKRQEWLRTEYTDSSIPTMFVKVPDTVMWTPEQLRAYETVVNEQLSGQTAERLKLRFLAPGLSIEQMNRFTDMYKPEFDLFLVRLICTHFDVMPSELGFVPSRGLGGKGHQDGEENSEYRKGILPLAAWLSDLLTNLSVRYLDMPAELEFKFSGLEAEDEHLRAEIDQIRIFSGQRTVDELRADQGLAPFGLPMTSAPLIVAGGVLTPLTEDPTDKPEPPPPGQFPAAGPPGQSRPPGPGAPPQPQPAPSPDARKEILAYASFMERRAGKTDTRDFVWKAVTPDLRPTLERLGRRGDFVAVRAVADEVKHAGVEGGNGADPVRTVSHLTDGIAVNLAHARRHLDQTDSGDGDSAFNAEHARRHMDDALDHVQRLSDFVAGHPTVAAEWFALHDDIDTARGVGGALGKASARGSRARGTAKKTALHRYASTIATHHATRIAQALRGVYDPKAIVDALDRERGHFKAAGEFLHVANAVLASRGAIPASVLDALYGEAWLSGIMGARVAAGVAPPDARYWNEWEPGNAAAAARVLGVDPANPGAGLQDLLRQAGVTIHSIDTNLQGRLAQIIADSLDRGDPPRDLEAAINDELGGRADLIAVTETARAQTAATLDTYQTLGVTAKQFLTSMDDLVDDDCQTNEDQGPIALDDDFTNGDPPVHPNCRCVIIPADTEPPD